MTDDSLIVWHENTIVGKLWQNEVGKMGFSYDDNWLTQGFSISQQLPLNVKHHSPESNKAHQFYANLLPEEDARRHIVKDFKISDSDFELLRAIGGECAGALSILPPDISPKQKISYSKLSDSDLKKILLRKGKLYTIKSKDERPRLSLAGAQDKCPIYLENDEYFIPSYSAPSTHILKFAIPDYANVPLYECFMSELASSIGLPTVEIKLIRLEKIDFITIKRFDRIYKSPKQIVRLHQEDFCQALGVSYNKKYEQHGGPSFQDCFKLIQNISMSPIEDAENLLRWLIFNFLAGNSDAHAKNLALLYNIEHQPHLAPFYDLVCTRANERIDTKLAMSIGGEFRPDLITLKHWHQLAEDCDVRENYITQLLRKTSQTLLNNFTKIENQFEAKYGKQQALQRVKKVLGKQCNRLIKQL